MYSDKTQWGAPGRRRTNQSGGDEYDTNSTQRNPAAANYYGLEGSESSASGGFTQIARVGAGQGHSRSGSVGGNQTANGEEGSSSGEKTQREKVNQIVQAFFWKSAMTIIQARMNVKFTLAPKTGERKPNKWV